jgi:hypothetical protein
MRQISAAVQFLRERLLTKWPEEITPVSGSDNG